MLLQNVSTCPVCEGKTFTHFLTAKDYTTTQEEFQIQRCNSCGLLLTNPRPDESSIGKYYESTDYISHTGGTHSLFDVVYRTARKYTITRKRNLIELFANQGVIMDLGCGTGEFLASFEKSRWKRIGLEPSPSARARIDKEIEVHTALSESNTKADVVTLWHVLEHVHDPNRTLQQIRAALKESGTLFIAVPNYEAWDAQYYEAKWAAYDVPRHLWHFSKNTMQKLLEKNDFKLNEVRPMPFDAYYVSLLSEKYKNPNHSSLSRTINALKTGFLSNARAKHNNYSSLLYIAK